MILSNDDIKSIEGMGYDKNYFVRIKEGWLKLKNKDGRCVFHNGKICLIYKNRPEGCKIYPLIFNEELGSAVIDEECPHKDSFKFNSEDINKLHDLIAKLKLERDNRK
jgi:Fe-S-cluster containining protein